MNWLSENNSKRDKFLALMFKNYYSSKFNAIYCPSSVQFREFGFFYWDPNKFIRHLGFPDFNSLHNHVISKVPQHLYCSATRYEVPDAPNMKLKSYIDCDLIFDFDVDHIPTPCKEQHDQWTCKKCGTAGKGSAPESCPSTTCDSKSFQENTWECEQCMEIAKSSITFIIEEFLAKDFGINPKTELYVVFSGRRGYHIHVEKEAIRNLDTNARREIVDYIMGKGLVPSYHGFIPLAQSKPNISQSGWRGRIASWVLRLLSENSTADLEKILPGSIDTEIARNEIMAQLQSTTPLWAFKYIGNITWNKLIQAAVDKYGGKIDQPVTIDTHRLIRLPGSLHGKTGFLVKKLAFNELEQFDPFSHAQVFGGTQQIYVKEAPQFRIGKETIGPLKDTKVELSMSAAIFLLAKGLANLPK